jgi:hypothetical protein
VVIIAWARHSTAATVWVTAALGIAKDALEAVFESWERSFDAAGQGAVALNRKVIDTAQRTSTQVST